MPAPATRGRRGRTHNRASEGLCSRQTAQVVRQPLCARAGGGVVVGGRRGRWEGGGGGGDDNEEEATEVEEGGEEASGDVDDIGAITITATITPGPSTPTSAQPPSVETPEQRIVGPAAAAAEKARAGEGRNVEHVALEDETEEAGSKRARKL